MPTDSFFHYQNGSLYCEGVPVSEVSKQYGSPVFVTSKASILSQYHAFEEAFQSLNHLTCYSVKANYNLEVIKVLVDAGCGFDVNSGGELFRALKAGAEPSKIIMAGVGKTAEEIEYALSTGIMMIKAESQSELILINEIAKKNNLVAPVGIRVNPNVLAETHPYITTGDSEEKFGIDETLAEETFSLIKRLENLNLIGLDMHIGSQIFDTLPYYEATLKLLGVKNIAESMGFEIEHIDIGGGFPVTYNAEKPATPIAEFAKKLVPILSNLNAKVIFEPGRYMVANASVLLTKVLYRKQNYKDKIFLIVDSAMTELLRPSLYKSHHDVLAVAKKDNEILADIVGPVCESGDFFARARKVGDVQEGELLAVMSSGAYGSVMGSNYNARLKPAEVLVSGDAHKLIRKRESYEQLIQNEML
ncbi:diaminopimelate decarboxylase [Chloroherpeton thalassium ATCC 35110]|uniref:Diaminopimelate decarboxylase n=1 Tax=Chloroherpeton thalassium (strain ATCC 35110 / GB-78) TaxID=517418 RepID=B3QT24_CHLT3|nr:diaminopimelate decarboxylase [Chloroherpeton thalassium]ACF12667.1 diaminopimelate decarboxylase [Chloroherpeton thalassium ATCC 35110]